MQYWSIIEIDSRVFERNLGKIRFTRTFPSLLFGSCTDLEGLIPPLLFQIKMFSLCLMRGWYCRGISVEIEMYFDSIMDSIKTHQSDHCRMERRRRGWRRREVMQSGAGAAAAGRGHHAPRCCHSRSVLTQTRDTDTRIHSHMKVEVFQPYIGPPYSID